MVFTYFWAMDYQEQYKKVLLSRAHCNLGKKGITNDFVNHVQSLLKKYKIIKIHALKSIANKSNIKEIASHISQATDSYVLDIRGRMIIVSNFQLNK